MEKVQLIARYVRAITFALDTFLSEVKKIKQDNEKHENSSTNNVSSTSNISNHEEGN